MVDKEGKPSGKDTKVKVRHGLAFYLDKDGHQRTVFRNQVVSVPASEAERLRAQGAVVDAGEELPMGGRITPIPNTASDEELIAWVSVATKGEIVTAISDNPSLGDRILAARDIVQKRLEAQNELLSGIDSTVKQGKALGKKRSKADKRGAPTTGANGKNATSLAPSDADADEEDEEDDDEELEEDDPREVVKGSITGINRFLKDNPDKAEEVLEAEKELALDKQRDVRESVVHLVENTVNSRNQ